MIKVFKIAGNVKIIIFFYLENYAQCEENNVDSAHSVILEFKDMTQLIDICCQKGQISKTFGEILILRMRMQLIYGGFIFLSLFCF